MKNNKAFTLIELLAVILILSVITVFAITLITKSVREKKNEISDALKEVIISANELYTTSNRKQYPNTNGNVYCVTLKTLVEQDYLNNPLVDPTTKNEIDQNKFVKTSINDGRYTYDIVNECEEVRRIENIYDAAKLLVYDNGICKTDGTTYNYKGGCYIKGI